MEEPAVGKGEARLCARLGLSAEESTALLAAMREYYPRPYALTAITIDMGLEGMDFSPIAEYCESLGVPFHIVKTQIGPIIFDYRKEKNPCSMCAKMRRGALNKALTELGYSKVALGHHYDDAVETFLMSLLFEGRLSCFQPVTFLDRTGVTQIRPMLYISEQTVARFAAVQALHGAEDVRLEIRVGHAEIGDQLLDLLPLCVFVGRAAVFDHRKLLLLCKTAHHSLGQIEHRTDLRHAGAVEVGHGLKAA